MVSGTPQKKITVLSTQPMGATGTVLLRSRVYVLYNLVECIPSDIFCCNPSPILSLEAVLQFHARKTIFSIWIKLFLSAGQIFFISNEWPNTLWFHIGLNFSRWKNFGQFFSHVSSHANICFLLKCFTETPQLRRKWDHYAF